MGWLIVDVQTQADLESLLARSAEVGKHGERGDGPWYWLMSSLLFRPALEPMLVAACSRFGGGTDAEVRAMLDWFFEEHDLWRYIDLLESWSAKPPAWWNAQLLHSCRRREDSRRGRLTCAVARQRTGSDASNV